AWTILIMRHFQHLLAAMPEECPLSDLPHTLMGLLDQLQFSTQINLPFEPKAGANDIAQATLDVRGRESLRRAISAAVRSFEYASEVVSAARVSAQAVTRTERSLTDGLATRVLLPVFIDEVERC